MSDVDEDAILSDAEGEQEIQEAVGEDEKAQFCHLTQETISQGLSLLCQTGNGLGHAFVRLDLRDKRLNDIATISKYIHLRFLDVSNNHLTDLSPLASLSQLLWLKVDSNPIASLKGQPFAQLTFLQWLSMAVNRLTDLDGPVGAALESLNLSGNSIQSVSGLQSGCFNNLVTLELRGNNLDTTDGINLPNLQRLYLVMKYYDLIKTLDEAQNSIKHLEGLWRLERLTTLHLRDNHLDSLNGLSPKMKCLQYLNVRGNTISDKNALQCLGLVSKTLRTLVMSENPVVETADYRLSVLMLLQQLERLDKDPVSPEERTEAREIQKLKGEEISYPYDL